ncbi:MAG: SMC family ATPase [Eubacteriales bacterium]|nr:SMC family ATPase [Eubacteriales bacterium]
MRPLQLSLQAFGSYGQRTTINFEEAGQNIFLITGNTGAGKTTIFDALVFALYGEASSSLNKKDGVVLQSQFAALETEPFVELTFAEGEGEYRNVYTVHRVPRHLKRLTRGAAKGLGTREAAGSVTLYMPDGSEYPQKEADRKIVEIIGLTKGQFMQVAMIAQGEFMELLRAKSDDKKVIFRKLFGTEIFQRISDEFGSRRKAKEREIEEIRADCQREASRVLVPGEYDRREELDRLKTGVTGGEMAVMEQFLEELGLLCDKLQKEEDGARRSYQEAGRLRDEKRDACTGGMNLLKFFEQLEKAQEELAACREAEAGMQKAKILEEKLGFAYEIKKEYERYQDARKTADTLEEGLKSQMDILPGLKRAVREAAEKEAGKKELFNQELETFSKVSERAQKALEVFRKIASAKKDVADRQEACEKARNILKEARKKETDFEKQEKVWKEKAQALEDADRQLALWEARAKEASELVKNASEVCALQQEVQAQEQKVGLAKEAYRQAREWYNEKREQYNAVRQAFFDGQAGLLAKDLKPGEPCPVCGSTKHPKPHRWQEDAQDISRERLEALGEETDELAKRQEEKAGAAKAAAELFAEKRNTMRNALEKLRCQMAERMPGIPKEMTPKQAEEQTMDWQTSVLAEGEKRKKDAGDRKELQRLLQEAGEKKRELAASATAAQEAAGSAQAALEGSKAALRALEGAGDYATEAEAREALKQAKDRKEQREAAYQRAAAVSAQAKTSADHAEALIGRYNRELPQLKEQCARRRESYENLMKQKGLTEPEWKTLTETYDSAKAQELRRELEEYRQRKALAEKMATSAREAIGSRKRPVMDKLQRDMEEAEQKWQAAEKTFEECRENRKVNQAAYDALAPKMEERKKTVGEYVRLDTLYRLTSGNMTDGRMDLETFVQRCYLEKILYAANRRFCDMSAGQFELRMVGAESAGKGRNRGLDLMVYSAVTGKEREIRTLSGGESFMAALSMALGMADQIQQRAAAVNLDVMFIDEGFGSLDEHSRNQAVRVLREMAGGTKMIGIISHVAELRQEIDSQLLVSRDEKGSHVKWQIS